MTTLTVLPSKQFASLTIKWYQFGKEAEVTIGPTIVKANQIFTASESTLNTGQMLLVQWCQTWCTCSDSSPKDIFAKITRKSTIVRSRSKTLNTVSRFRWQQVPLARWSTWRKKESFGGSMVCSKRLRGFSNKQKFSTPTHGAHQPGWCAVANYTTGLAIACTTEILSSEPQAFSVLDGSMMRCIKSLARKSGLATRQWCAPSMLLPMWSAVTKNGSIGHSLERKKCILLNCDS